MKSSIETISLSHLALTFIPVSVVIYIMYRWAQNYRHAIYAIARMLVQLLAIGYVLNFIFESENTLFIYGVLTMMLIVASHIALHPIRQKNIHFYWFAFVAILISGGSTLILVTQVVLNVEPSYSPSVLIPIAGMIFANSMTGISVAVERFSSEYSRGSDYKKARSIAFNAAMIPITSSLFAVGLVSLPGMMTGQILSGVSPLIAARYQIMVMCMIFGSVGITAALFLTMLKNKLHYFESQDITK